MKENLLTRFELELAMLHRIYRCMDENELAVLFEKVTGHSLNEWDNKRNAWQCDVPFEHLVSADVGTALDFLTDYWERHEVQKNFVTRSQQNGGDCNHEWVVFSTALQEVCLMVECVECGAFGTVDDPTKQEWRRAFSASSHPYGWAAKERVTVRGTPGMRHVERVR